MPVTDALSPPAPSQILTQPQAPQSGQTYTSSSGRQWTLEQIREGGGVGGRTVYYFTPQGSGQAVAAPGPQFLKTGQQVEIRGAFEGMGSLPEIQAPYEAGFGSPATFVSPIPAPKPITPRNLEQPNIKITAQPYLSSGGGPPIISAQSEIQRSAQEKAYTEQYMKTGIPIGGGPTTYSLDLRDASGKKLFEGITSTGGLTMSEKVAKAVGEAGGINIHTGAGNLPFFTFDSGQKNITSPTPISNPSPAEKFQRENPTYGGDVTINNQTIGISKGVMGKITTKEGNLSPEFKSAIEVRHVDLANFSTATPFFLRDIYNPMTMSGMPVTKASSVAEPGMANPPQISSTPINQTNVQSMNNIMNSTAYKDIQKWESEKYKIPIFGPSWQKLQEYRSSGSTLQKFVSGFVMPLHPMYYTEAFEHGKILIQSNKEMPDVFSVPNIATGTFFEAGKLANKIASDPQELTIFLATAAAPITYNYLTTPEVSLVTSPKVAKITGSALEDTKVVNIAEKPQLVSELTTGERTTFGVKNIPKYTSLGVGDVIINPEGIAGEGEFVKVIGIRKRTPLQRFMSKMGVPNQEGNITPIKITTAETGKAVVIDTATGKQTWQIAGSGISVNQAGELIANVKSISTAEVGVTNIDSAITDVNYQGVASNVPPETRVAALRINMLNELQPKEMSTIEAAEAFRRGGGKIYLETASGMKKYWGESKNTLGFYTKLETAPGSGVFEDVIVIQSKLPRNIVSNLFENIMKGDFGFTMDYIGEIVTKTGTLKHELSHSIKSIGREYVGNEPTPELAKMQQAMHEPIAFRLSPKGTIEFGIMKLPKKATASYYRGTGMSKNIVQDLNSQMVQMPLSRRVFKVESSGRYLTLAKENVASVESGRKGIGLARGTGLLSTNVYREAAPPKAHFLDIFPMRQSSQDLSMSGLRFGTHEGGTAITGSAIQTISKLEQATLESMQPNVSPRGYPVMGVQISYGPKFATVTKTGLEQNLTPIGRIKPEQGLTFLKSFNQPLIDRSGLRDVLNFKSIQKTGLEQNISNMQIQQQDQITKTVLRSGFKFNPFISTPSPPIDTGQRVIPIPFGTFRMEGKQFKPKKGKGAMGYYEKINPINIGLPINKESAMKKIRGFL